MTLEEIKAVIGEPKCLTEEDWADLVKASTNDSHEGAEMLPRYKVALEILAKALGIAFGTLNGVMITRKGDANVPLIHGALLRTEELFKAHLKFCTKGN